METHANGSYHMERIIMEKATHWEAGGGSASIPKWARDRAEFLVTKPDFRAINPFSASLHAFARYIAEHEDPPRDPTAQALANVLATDKSIGAADYEALAYRIATRLVVYGVTLRKVGES
jgi:hypothetical protein